ncbi:hypothetical protein RvY_16213-2 [Ramazzottius varieornatus]|uniref:Uncharacterized protein n=1 Tax=Ramazzottius varieornatus TaxID=947166 RepID=A0A1D1VZ06_RAMVA|nr:hypothetical protein RvY_16213-2 [Ramazzottius varieornatus]
MKPGRPKKTILPSKFGAAPRDVDERSALAVRRKPKRRRKEKGCSAFPGKRRRGRISQESFDNEDGGSEDDTDDDTQSEESDDEMEASTSNGAKKSLGRVRSTKFTSSVKFYRLYSHWKRSLGALDYAKCEVYGCGVVTATLPEIIKHHRTCLKVGHKLLPGVAKHSHDLMKCHNCKYRSHELRRMIRHYQNVHKMIFEEAEEKANEKKLLRSSWQLTQKAYDDLKLFD